MVAHDAVTYRQAESGPLPYGFGSEKRFKDVWHVLAANPAAVVFDFDYHVIVRILTRTCFNRASRVACLNGIEQQVQHDLIDLATLTMHAGNGLKYGLNPELLTLQFVREYFTGTEDGGI